MKVKGPIHDPNPREPAGELDVVTFTKTDLSREMIKGDIGAVMSVYHDHPGLYLVEVNNNSIQEVHRSEFRLALPEDIARKNVTYKKKAARAEKNGTDMEYRFRIPQFPGDPKI